ncbi:hypothetical protein K0C01_05080 [Salinarchaeum sp. IM2453]|uniref:hypothetical protein n=1 Tax=Salinarchaeum sp. IM2453 TaxID=2862870 RepID=UPI001C82EF6D|nr:hypothetical protein [Salinarchaeum sp. IM2453]QZA89508.1 hypothetical protein K0C01_05080 [Salinarchaeum sp. IM2453]
MAGISEEHLEKIVEERASDLRWTKTGYFKMEEYMKRISSLISLITIATAGGLGVSIAQGLFEGVGQIIIATIAASTGLVNLAFNPGLKSYKYYSSGEKYNSLLKEYEEYYYQTLLDDSQPFEKRQEKLKQLNERKRDIDKMTPPIPDFVMNRIGEDDLGGTMDFTKIRSKSE